MKIEGVMYVTTETLLPHFLSSSDEVRAKMVHYHHDPALNMDDAWVRVGSFTAEVDFQIPEGLVQQSVEKIENQLADLEQKYLMARNELRERRSSLLCLEAPK